MEAVAVSIVLPSGEVVAQLSVNPQKPVLQLKTQIAGLEGTPVGNQILLLHDKQVDDGDTLDSLDITSSATFILLRRAPLLSGAINREDLDHLLQDNLALQQAIEAYSNDLQYLPADIAAMSRQVMEGLIASGSVPEMPLPEILEDQWKDLLDQTGKARQVAFSRVLRAELEKIAFSVPPGASPGPALPAPAHPRSAPAVLPTPAPAAGRKDPSCYTERLQPDAVHSVQEQGAATADPSLRHVDLPQRVGKPAGPWTGAGQELKEFLHRRWSLCERQDVV
ncbi:Scn10a [Symbiodinium natans]|uniref:Scn10a protein n=1 Tax=Symbiodinium natans TaxID=878477 RepID=A0A812L2Z3_9DINO|nr:Scn10a [Symbiodinium natans]